jgi:hypothetical protein
MSLEIPLNVDLDRRWQRLRVSKSEKTIVSLIWLHLLDARRVELIDGLDNGGKRAVVAFSSECPEGLLILGLAKET